jgi:acetolactate synthase-1/2/3 large subunit
MKYSDYFIDSLVELGYTHCFFIGGGNILHLLESARTRLECIAVVHEVSAGIAAEYFNVANRGSNKRAFAMVTAGPGVTNITTAVAGAWLESRELLVIGGQARTDVLSRGTVRQVGHQELDGAAILKPLTKISHRIEAPISFAEIKNFVDASKTARKGPVFLELCLDVTATFVDLPEAVSSKNKSIRNEASQALGTPEFWNAFGELWSTASRPLFLIGGGLSFSVFQKHLDQLKKLGVPMATTWNAIDYLDFDEDLYAGRPNTYGMRWANAVIQQADLVVSIGARLGLQQTGFAWEQFIPQGQLIRIDIDQEELKRPHPKSDLNLAADADQFLPAMLSHIEGLKRKDLHDWLSHIHYLRQVLVVVDAANDQFAGHANPFTLVNQLGEVLASDTQVVSCSSGGAYTSLMQAFPQKVGQLVTNNKALASMGYGLAGAIGTAFAHPKKKTILVEGDGGFAQNLSELGTVANRNLNLKIFLFSNLGYASIRVSQKAYFNGAYIGCDAESGVGLPDWKIAFAAYGIETLDIFDKHLETDGVLDLLNAPGPAGFIVHIHPDQSFLPKITSRIFRDGKMKSNPIHLMDPQLEQDLADAVFKYLPANLRAING